MKVTDLNSLFGNMDIYLLDSLLKGYFEGKSRVLDIGCGEGRNLIYLTRTGYDVYGVDTDSSAIKLCRMMARTINRDFDTSHFMESDARNLPFENEYFDAIISSAVMHFATNEEDFMKMMDEGARVLRKEGIFFIRMASDIGLENKTPSGGFSFYLTRELIETCSRKFSLQKLEPVKSVNVEDTRVMTTLLLKKLT